MESRVLWFDDVGTRYRGDIGEIELCVLSALRNDRVKSAKEVAVELGDHVRLVSKALESLVQKGLVTKGMGLKRGLSRLSSRGRP